MVIAVEFLECGVVIGRAFIFIKRLGSTVGLSVSEIDDPVNGEDVELPDDEVGFPSGEFVGFFDCEFVRLSDALFVGLVEGDDI